MVDDVPGRVDARSSPTCCGPRPPTIPSREAYVHEDKRARTAGSTAPPTASPPRSSTAACSRGDVVCLMLPSSIKFAACYFGAARVGAITSADQPAPRPGRAGEHHRPHRARGHRGRRRRHRPRRRPTPATSSRSTRPEGRVRRRPARHGCPRSRPTTRCASSGRAAPPARPRARCTPTTSMAAIARNVADMAARPRPDALRSLPFPHLGYMGWIAQLHEPPE